MLYWALGICVVVCIVAFILGDSICSEGLTFIAVVFFIAAIIIAFMLFKYNADVKSAYVIEQKIEMYEEENAEIESEISTLVEMYMDYEQETLEALKVEGSLITLVNMYPELKSDELVQSQINLYISNQNKIIELKESLIDLDKKKIWLGITD